MPGECMNFMYVANWKMNMSTQQVRDFCASIQTVAIPATSKLVLCPSFVHIPLVVEKLHSPHITVGAQDCAPYDSGAYTGAISARMLAELQCKYCIVGHSERRIYCNELSEDIALKVAQLITNRITPIVCIGESAHEYSAHQTFEILENQLKPIARILQPHTSIHELCIAYEPVWAIGTGNVPSLNSIQQIAAWISNYAAQHMPTVKRIRVLYGGSVDATNARSIGEIEGINGLLIGGASLDFQKIKNIVVW